MKDRIMKIMKDEGMDQKDFAAALKISPSSLSNIFNGRSNPTSNHVSAIHRRFPEININWLMFGEGEMYKPVNEDEFASRKQELSSEYSDISRGGDLSSAYASLADFENIEENLYKENRRLACSKE